MFASIVIILTCGLLTFIHGSDALFRKQFPSPIQIDPNRSDYGEPLFLTPLIRAGQLKEARQRSLVTGLPGLTGQLESYSGFITINEKYNRNTFFWFFPAKTHNVPLMVWLQGGPGASSLYGLFAENGPIEITQNLTPAFRKYAWTNVGSMIYIENPIGTGFSFTDDDKGYATTIEQIADDLYEFLNQFLTLFSEYKKNDFYLTGESYAGKYIPALGYRIFKNNTAGINFKGFALGDGWCDPVTMLDYGDLLYQIGLLDEKQRDYFKSQEKLIVKYINEGKYLDALYIEDPLLDGDLYKSPTTFTNFTGSTNYNNFLHSSEYIPGFYNQYLALPAVRRAIHVGNLTFYDGSTVEKHLLNDIMQSVKPWVEVLMDNYKVLMYNGQLDIIVGSPLTEKFLQTVQWKHRREYLQASRKIWKVDPKDNQVAGYIRNVHNFSQVIVRNAGHIVPYDQPRAAFDMISKFITDKF